MKKLLSILLLLNFLVFILPVSTKKNTARQYLTNIPMEEEKESSKEIDLKEINFNILQEFTFNSLSAHIYYLLEKEKFVHYVLSTDVVEWLDTFSPPPDFT